MGLFERAPLGVLPLLAGLHCLDALGPLQTAFRLREHSQPIAGITGFERAQGRKQTAALGAIQPDPGLGPLQFLGLPAWRWAGSLCSRSRLTPGPIPGLGSQHKTGPADAESEGEQHRSKPTTHRAGRGTTPTTLERNHGETR